MRAIRLYTDYTLEPEECSSKKGLRKAKAGILKRLKDDKQTGKRLRTTTRFYFRLPLSTAHKVHPVGEAATIGHSIHPKIASKIRELVSENITSPDVVRKCLEQYVDKEMFGSHEGHQKPRKSNRRYYPSRQDLRGHIARAISASKYCGDDQESLKRKIEQWRRDSPSSKFYFRTRDEVKDGDETKFLFVHQEEWQRRLLLRYGSDLVLMDATYKTTKYAIPLFFVCVHTSVGYKVVAKFLCQNEDNECIAEALNIIKSWNPTWKPKYFVIDYSIAEINTIESEFLDGAVYIMRFSLRAGVAEMGQSRQKWTDRDRGTEDVSRTDASNCSCSFGDVLQEGRGKPEKVDVVLGKSQSTRILREGVVGLFRSLGSCISCSTGRQHREYQQWN